MALGGGGIPLDSHEHMELKGLRSSTKKNNFQGCISSRLVVQVF